MSRPLIAAAAVALALLAGCGDSAEPSPPPTSEDALTTTSDAVEETQAAPTTEAPETEEPEADGPPQMPDEATEKTEAGAEAFVEYYVDTLNAAHLGQATADDVRALALETCKTCAGFANAVEVKPFGEPYMEFEDATPVLIDNEALVETEVAQVSDGSIVEIVFTLEWQEAAWAVSKIQSVG